MTNCFKAALCLLTSCIDEASHKSISYATVKVSFFKVFKFKNRKVIAIGLVIFYVTVVFLSVISFFMSKTSLNKGYKVLSDSKITHCSIVFNCCSC